MTGPPEARRSAFAPGRVNLIGDHTDYTGGLVLPVATHLGTTVTGVVGGDAVDLSSDAAPGRAVVALASPHGDGWGAVVAAVVALVRPVDGLVGEVATTLPVGAGLSSSAALEVALALALGSPATGVALAELAQTAEHRATGVPCGIMDQLASVCGVAEHALLIDCQRCAVDPVPIPEGWEIHVVHSEVSRSLAGSAYAERRAACEAAEREIGPLRLATAADAEALADPALRRRARHVVGENERVRVAADALLAADASEVGDAMAASHASLRDDFEVSHPAVDGLVAALAARPGVIGARMTGAGFGGCVVALTLAGADLAPAVGDRRHWRVRASNGAHLVDAGLAAP